MNRILTHSSGAECEANPARMTQIAGRIIQLALGGTILISATASAISLAPHPYQMMNRHGINMASSQVSPSLTDLSIGGSLGLTHSISTYTSNFSNYDGQGPLGYKDRFSGGIVKAMHHYDVNCTDPMRYDCQTSATYVLRVFDDGASFDFLINPDNTWTPYNLDMRHTLTFDPNMYGAGKSGFLWIKPDGTEVRFSYTGSSYDARGVYGLNGFAPLESITYPNGFKITVIPKTTTDVSVGASLGSVVTNTGFQLKYVYVKDTRPDPVYPQNAYESEYVSSCGTPRTVGWSDDTPKYVVGINNAIDYCSSARITFTTPDSLFNGPIENACPGMTQNWPKATYTWPAGMPRVMCQEETKVTVEDATGGVTEFWHAPQYPPAGTDTHAPVPRVTGIKSSTSTVRNINYTYVSDFANVQSYSDFALPDYVVTNQARFAGSTISTDTGDDGIGCSAAHPLAYRTPGQFGIDCNSSHFISMSQPDPGRGYFSMKATTEFGPWEIDTWDKTIEFDQFDRRDQPTSIKDKIGSITSSYLYDNRGNLMQITETDAITQTSLIVKQAGYPTDAECATLGRKVCNQAKWIKDANGNQTDYTYDPASGQVASIKSPADKNGIRPEVRYTYKPKYAYYKNASGAFQRAATPVYLLTQETKCQTSATNADGSCVAANDQVVTDYDYGPASGPNNLFLRGVAVTAYNGSAMETRRTCYSYDPYGNRIGETKPKAGLASCY